MAMELWGMIFGGIVGATIGLSVMFGGGGRMLRWTLRRLM